MSYHNTSNNTPNSARQSTTNAQRQVAPPGYHYMPDGTLMLDEDHAALQSPGSISNLLPTNDPLPVYGSSYHLWARLACSVRHWSTPQIGSPTMFMYGAEILQHDIYPLVNYNLSGTVPAGCAASQTCTNPMSVPSADSAVNNEIFYQWAGSPAIGTIVAWQGSNDLGTYGGNYTYTPAVFMYVGKAGNALPTSLPNSNLWNIENPGLNSFPGSLAQTSFNHIGHLPYYGPKTFFNCEDALNMVNILDPTIQPVTSDSYTDTFISSFNIDFSDLPAATSTRPFEISGTNGAQFILEIQNEDGHYYSFETRTFSAAKCSLKKTITNSIYKDSIKFPTITDNDHYDISIQALGQTKHAQYFESRLRDGSIDINGSTGSNSLLMNKIIYQYTDLTLTIAPSVPTSDFTIGSIVNDTFTIPKSGKLAKTAFTISCTSASAESFVIIKQPTTDEVLSTLTVAVGTAPENLPGENIHPTITTAADSTGEGGTTVNGASTGRTVTTHVVSSTIATVGDRVLGNDALAAATVTVTAVSGGSGKTFTISESISIADDLPLSFSNQKNHQWPLANVEHFESGMIVLASTNVTQNTSVSTYQDTVSIFKENCREETLIKNKAKAIDLKNQTPTMVDGKVTVQPGNIVFDKQQVLVLSEDNIKIGGYGTKRINDVFGYGVNFTDLKITLTPITTTTTAAVQNSASVVLAARDGILNSTSTVSGIGINPSVVNPTVNSGANATGAGTVVLSAVQTIENGATLTFAGAGKVATITGNIEVTNAGESSQTLNFDVEKLLTAT